MKINLLLPAGLVALILTSGCETTGLSRREQGNTTYPSYILNLHPKASSGPPAKLSTPLRMAVVQVGEPAPPKAMLDKLQSSNSLVATAIGLPSCAEPRNRPDIVPTVAPEHVQNLCQLARSLGANYLFVFGGNLDSWRDVNALVLLDLTGIGAATLPSTKIHTEGKAAGALIDAVACEPVLLTSVDAKRSIHSPSMMANGKTETVRAALRDELTIALADEFLQTLVRQKTLAATRTTIEQ